MKKISTLCLLAFAALCSLTSCNEDPEAINNVPEVFVDEASELLRTSAVLTGRIMAPAKASIQEHGFKVSTTSDFSSSDTQIIKMDGDLVSFSTQITDLEIGETYFYAAYASNGLDEMTSIVKAFTTPTRSEVLLSDFVLANQDAATFSARVSDTGGGEILSVGFCWSETNDPTIFSGEHSFATLNESDNSFRATLPLERGTKYYVRAFAESDITVSGSSTISYSREAMEYYAILLPTAKLTARSRTSTTLSFSLASTYAEQVKWLILPQSELDIYGDVTAAMVLDGGDEVESNKTVVITAEGLLPETAYLIYAAAENQDGAVLSDPIEMTTSQAATVTLKSKESTVSTLSFTIATTNAEKAAWVVLSPSELSSYGTVTAGKVLTSKNSIETNKEVPVTVENLNPETTYTIYAAAEKEGVKVLSQKLEMTTTTAPTVTTQATAQHVTSLEFTVSTLNAEKAAWVALSPEELSSFGAVTAEKVLTSKNTIETNKEVSVMVENLNPETTYTIYAAAEKEGIAVLSQKLEMTTIAAPTVTTQATAQHVNSLEFTVSTLNAEKAAWVALSPEELSSFGTVTAEKVLSSGESVETNKEVAVTAKELTPETTYTIYAAAEKEGVKVLSQKLEMTTEAVLIPETWKIYYTSTDENIVEPYDATVFGANIVSNTYENGRGLILFDGPVTEIGYQAFHKCSSLKSITIPGSVTSIGTVAFAYCSSLISISIPDGVTSIGNSAFSGCSVLTDITIPDSVVFIGDGAFWCCFGITSFIIPDGVISIENYTFWQCAGLTSVTIPDGVTSIGAGAFINCSSLTSVYCKQITPPVGSSDMFTNNAPNRKIYVPSGSLTAYKTAEYWSDYADYIYPMDSSEEPEKEFAEYEGYFVYHGETYKTVTLADGNTWMAENLRYIPEGKSVSSDPVEDAGIWYPAANAEKVADPELVATLGLLYDAATAYGVEAITVENAATFEGTQGICPEGWHIPTVTEMTGLVGHCSNSALINTEGAYYDATIKGASIAALGEDGFPWSFASCRNKLTTAKTGSYLVTSYNDVYGVMSYLIGSSWYQTKTNDDSSISNVQYYYLMSTLNVSNEKVITAYGNFLSGASLRCVKNK